MNWPGSLRLKIVETTRATIGTGCICGHSMSSSHQILSNIASLNDKECSADRQTYEVSVMILIFLFLYK